MHCWIVIFFSCLQVQTAAPLKGVQIGVARTNEPLQPVVPKHGGRKVGDQEKARGKHIAQESDADEVSNSVVNSKTKVIDPLIALYVSLFFSRREKDDWRSLVWLPGLHSTRERLDWRQSHTQWTSKSTTGFLTLRRRTGKNYTCDILIFGTCQFVLTG